LFGLAIFRVALTGGWWQCAVVPQHTAMKKLLVLLLAGASVALAETTPPTPAQQAEAYYARGIGAEKAGDLEGARAAYTKALQADPNHANCRFRLNQLKIDGPAIAAKGREAKFNKVLIPSIQLDGATLQESLDALAIMINKESKGGLAANFLVQDPQKKLGTAKISLNLKNIPASAAMKYILTQVNAKARYDEHAVVIEPNS
jgi:tetratricopeptide (TPR) repeat protein